MPNLYCNKPVGRYFCEREREHEGDCDPNASQHNDGKRILPQDRRRLEKWQRLLHRGERVTLDSLDKATIDHIAVALSTPEEGKDEQSLADTTAELHIERFVGLDPRERQEMSDATPGIDEQERCPRCKAGNLTGCYCDHCGARYADPPDTPKHKDGERWEVLSYRPVETGNPTRWIVELEGPQPRGLGSILTRAHHADALAEAVDAVLRTPLIQAGPDNATLPLAPFNRLRKARDAYRSTPEKGKG